MSTVNGEKYKCLQQYVQSLKVKDVRTLFSYLRKLNDENPNIFFPAYGLTASEFAVVYVHNMNAKERRGGTKRAVEEGDNDSWTGDDTL